MMPIRAWPNVIGEGFASAVHWIEAQLLPVKLDLAHDLGEDLRQSSVFDANQQQFGIVHGDSFCGTT